MKKSFLAFFIFMTALTAKAERWVVTTLEWPPFTCSRCPENGAAAKALRDALKTVDVDVEFVFYPWSQTIKKAQKDDIVGYYPVWKETIRPGFTSSPALFKSPVGFIEQRSKPLKWEKLADLKGKLIGITEDYGNTVEFNKLAKQKIFKTEIAKADDTNVRKVAEGKLDGALMDINNARYFLYLAQPQLLSKVNVNERILENKDLFFAMNKDQSKKMTKLKAAVKNVNFQRIVDEYLVQYLRAVE